MFGIISIATFGISLGIALTNAQLQTPKEYRLFEKDLVSVNLNTFTYTDGTIIAYDIINPPLEKVIIVDWNRISDLDKSSITTTLTGLGYTDKGSFNPDATTEVILEPTNSTEIT